jgi:hypothetical protein
LGSVSIVIAGTRINAHSKHKKSEKMIRKAKVFKIIIPEKNSTAKPMITEKAFIAIPLPVVTSVF